MALRQEIGRLAMELRGQTIVKEQIPRSLNGEKGDLGMKM